MKATGYRIGAVSALLVATLAGAASAQQPSSAQAAAIRSACRADYQSHCANVPTGGSAALQCLMQNAPVSPGCQQALNAVQGGTGAAPAPAAPRPRQPAMSELAPPPTPDMRQACGPDYRRYCRGIPPGGGRALACLQSNSDRLSRPAAARSRRCSRVCTADPAQPAVMRSISANSSADNVQAPALTFCSICSGRVAPAMTLGPAPRQKPAERELKQGQSARARERVQLLDDRPVPVGQKQAGEPLGFRQPGALGKRRVAAILAGQQPARQREVGQQPHADAGRRDQIASTSRESSEYSSWRETNGVRLRARGPARSASCQPASWSSRCSAPCPAARDRRARAGSPRSAWADRGNGTGRGRSSRCAGASGCLPPPHDLGPRAALLGRASSIGMPNLVASTMSLRGSPRTWPMQVSDPPRSP